MNLLYFGAEFEMNVDVSTCFYRSRLQILAEGSGCIWGGGAASIPDPNLWSFLEPDASASIWVKPHGQDM